MNRTQKQISHLTFTKPKEGGHNLVIRLLR